ncbi:Mitochondrial distribution and morphology protein 34 [Sugiyamaella lignohabitans]|uniref:Mitochondrial distribution and morphology protein 34 n=1 Tax=Sugiyamaella lignohabitans TaxID=796027 RepID=A0A167ETG5_9ASCO|nr:Mitochondrial distribution and morphology protein 34 [Sugiyamaella lignohabitans]ANB14434.1 Mitochondrial distribution and morphology protein 34 [Sugiyamaella lignohabitans]
MSFKFNWSFFNKDSLLDQTSEVFKVAMNKGIKPDIIIGDMAVDKFELGTVPPSLEILEIGDLAEDKFRGIFKLEYAGDASLSIKTQVQANPLALLNAQSCRLRGAFPKIVGAACPLELPLSIFISEFKLSAIVIIVFSMARGLTLVFQNDPLESVKVSSTFDSLPGIAEFLQQEVEARLRESLRDDIPEVLHKLSQEKLVSSNRSEGMKELMTHLQHTPHSHRYSNAFAFTNDSSPIPDLFHGSDETVNGLHDLDASHSTLSIRADSMIPDCVTRSTLASFEEDLKAKAAMEEDAQRLKYQARHKGSRRYSSTSSSTSLSELGAMSPIMDAYPRLYRDVRPKKRVIKLSKTNSTISEPSTISPSTQLESPNITASTSTHCTPASPQSPPSRSTPEMSPLHSNKGSPRERGRPKRRELSFASIRSPSPIDLDFRAVLEKQKQKENLSFTLNGASEKTLSKWAINNQHQIFAPPKYEELREDL